MFFNTLFLHGSSNIHNESSKPGMAKEQHLVSCIHKKMASGCVYHILNTITAIDGIQ